MTRNELHPHEEPKRTRDDTRSFERYKWDPCDHWPRGLQIHIYDNGRVKVIGGWDTAVTVPEVISRGDGPKSKGGSHVIAEFRRA